MYEGSFAFTDHGFWYALGYALERSPKPVLTHDKWIN